MDINEKSRKKIKENSTLIKVVMLATIFGFFAGVVGQMVSHVYLDPYLTPNNYLTKSNEEDVIPEIKRIRKFLGTQQDFLVEDINEKAKLTLAGLYLKKPASNDLISTIYAQEDILANAFNLTSDGWLVTNSNVFLNYNYKNIVVNLNGKSYEIEEIVSDELTDVVFIKIDAQNLSVVVFGDWQEASIGQTVLVSNSTSRSSLTSIESLSYNTLSKTAIKSTEEFHKYILLKDELDKSFAGTVMFNLGGEVVGLVNIDLKTVIPINYLTSAINSVLRHGEIQRPSLGIKYIDLSQANAINGNKGAIIYQSPTRISAAYQAELKKDDIIIKVDDIVVDQNNDLTQLIQDYQAGDEVELIIIRDKKERIVEVFLGQVE